MTFNVESTKSQIYLVALKRQASKTTDESKTRCRSFQKPKTLTPREKQETECISIRNYLREMMAIRKLNVDSAFH